jgi:hypothetical protein
MRYGVVKARTIVHNRGESKPSSNGPFADGSASDSPRPRSIRESARLAAIAAGALVAPVLVACSSADPKYATGQQGIQGVTAPTPFPAGTAPPVDMSCDTSACTVHWSTDIFPYMKSTGPGQCAGQAPCHGAGQKPIMTDDDSTATYNSLVGYAFKSPAQRYVQPCADPSESGILCNLATPGSCGSPMPINGAASPSMDQMQKIMDWVKCGAPNN